ncbi:G-rich sequence factor 1-like isoform X2 [Symsagittifera roscoffensis]|uniref:G-rich sequence factor 1-like isoform X2 n=1 Tax=Symsagittifera roscoffensis TaxID=84072 RepID=UPI00307CA466
MDNDFLESGAALSEERMSRTISYDIEESDNTRKRSEKDNSTQCVVVLKGLPFSVTDNEIVDFLSPDVDVKASQIEKLFQRGKFTGDCLVSLRNEKEVDEAIKKHRKHIGSRYVEVFRSTGAERDRVAGGGGDRVSAASGRMSGGGRQSSGGGGGGGGRSSTQNNFVQLRGLPFMVKEAELKAFLSGCDVLQDGILFGPPTSEGSRRGSTCNGDAFVELATEEDVQNALKKHRKNIGSRYIEVFRCSFNEVERYMERHSGRSERRRSRSRDREPYPSHRSSHNVPPRRRSPPPIMLARRYETDIPRIPEYYPPEPELRPPARMVPLEYNGGYAPLVPDSSARLSELDRLERLNAARAIELEMRMAHSLPPPVSVPPPISGGESYAVEMEGFPYDCSRDELMDFLSPARPSYVEFVKDSSGKVQEAFAEFMSLQDLEVALSKHRKVIRSRWIAVRERRNERGVRGERRADPPRRDRSRSPVRRERSPYRDSRDRGSDGKNLVKLLGLPYECDERDIEDPLFICNVLI